MDTRKLLYDFCAEFCKYDSEKRKWMKIPFSQGDFSYAVNLHLFIRVPRVDDIPENPESKGMDRVIAGDINKDWYPVENVPMLEKAYCDDCLGNGRYYGKTCEYCDGEGKITPDIPFDFHGTVFNQKYLSYLSSLPNCQLSPQPYLFGALHYKPSPFRFDGGTGILMPMLEV